VEKFFSIFYGVNLCSLKNTFKCKSLLFESESAIIGGTILLEFSYYNWSEFQKFLASLSPKDALELSMTISKIQKYGLLIAREQGWVKKLDHNLFEIRSRRANNIQRVIYFHFEDELYVITHGFTKKTQRTPLKEIHKGQQRQIFYFTRKDHHNDN